MAQPTKVVIPSRFSITPVDFTWTAGVTTGQVVDWTPGDVLLVWNTSADTAYTVTVTSNPKFKRGTDTIPASPYSLAAGDFAVFPRMAGQDDDEITVTVSNVAVKVARLGTKADPA